MPQTLLVLLGVVLLGLFSLSRQQRYVQDEDSAARREVETVALGVFDRWKGHLTSLPFDECQTLLLGDAGDCVLGLYGLSPHLNFSTSLQSESGEVDFDTFDDFDDFSGYDQQHSYLVRGVPTTFRVRVDSVRYVDPMQPWEESASTTTAKQATLSVSYQPTRADGVAIRPIGLSQTVTVTADSPNL